MDELLSFAVSVLRFLFSVSGVDGNETAFPTLVFAAAAGLVGVIVVMVDYLMSLIPSPSFLKLAHSLEKLPLFLLIWGVGAGVAASLGDIANILEATPVSAVVAGIGWPIIMVRIAVASRAEYESEPEQSAIDEEEIDEGG